MVEESEVDELRKTMPGLCLLKAMSKKKLSGRKSGKELEDKPQVIPAHVFNIAEYF